MNSRQNLPEVSLRRARDSDAAAVYAWRNAEQTRRHFFDPEPVSREDHTAWFGRSVAAVNRHLLIAEDPAGTPVGVLRFDESADGGEAEVGIYLVPGRSGQGLGRAVMDAGLAWLRTETSVRRVTARVKEANGASIAMFEATGFTTEWRSMGKCIGGDVS